MDIITLENVSKMFGSKKNQKIALDNVSLKIKKGEFLGIMGPSGSGKSTFLNLVATIDRVSKGKIYLSGKSSLAMYDYELSEFRKNNIGFIFQNYNLLDNLTLRDNIMAPLLLRNFKKNEIDKRIDEFSKKLNIDKLLDKYPSECSGGEVQRAAACRAVVTKPALIIADEPTAALDSKNSKEFMELLKMLNKKEGTGVVVVTHDTFVGSYCERVVMLKNGKISKILEREEERQLDFYLYKIYVQ